MVAFSKPRLEGRAMEHVLAGNATRRIHMKDDTSGHWVWVGGHDAAEICKYMCVASFMNPGCPLICSVNSKQNQAQL